jgi:hypothetical protein
MTLSKKNAARRKQNKYSLTYRRKWVRWREKEKQGEDDLLSFLFLLFSYFLFFIFLKNTLQEH